MPMYEYHCEACQSDFEELVQPSQTDTFSPVCPECESSQVAKKFSAIAKPHHQNKQSAADCATGNCGLPDPPCAGGMCGLG